MHSLDKSKIKSAFGAAVGAYDDFAGLQRTVADALLEKFPLDASSGLVLDVGCGTGYLTRLMQVAQPATQTIALDIALPMLWGCREKCLDFPVRYVCGDAENMPFCQQSIQQIYSNLALQWCQDLAAVFADCQRMLKPDGKLVFATFGPATLRELKNAWAAVDSFTHVNEFFSLEQIIGFLQQVGFTEIVSDSIIYQSEYKSVLDLMKELKGLGAHNVNHARNRNTTSRIQLQRMIKAYAELMPGNDVLASYEIILVQARL